MQFFTPIFLIQFCLYLRRHRDAIYRNTEIYEQYTGISASFWRPYYFPCSSSFVSIVDEFRVDIKCVVYQQQIWNEIKEKIIVVIYWIFILAVAGELDEAAIGDYGMCTLKGKCIIFTYKQNKKSIWPQQNADRISAIGLCMSDSSAGTTKRQSFNRNSRNRLRKC